MPHGDRDGGCSAGTQTHVCAPANKVTEKRRVLPTFLPHHNRRGHHWHQPLEASHCSELTSNNSPCLPNSERSSTCGAYNFFNWGNAASAAFAPASTASSS